MDRKKIIILTSGIIAFIAIMVVSINIYNYFIWKNPLELDKNFILTWGNYSYVNYENYPETVKPLITEDIYNEYFGGTQNQQAQYIQLGRMTSKKTEVKTTLVNVLEKKKYGNTFQIKNQIEQTVISSGTTTTEKKTAIITITKDGDFYLVSEINYN